MTNKIYYNWNDTDSSWIENYKREYSYDNEENMTQHVVYNFEETTEQWIINWQRDYYYNEHNISQQVITNDISVFPNPFSKYFYIILKGNPSKIDFMLFNISGIKLLSKEISNSERINMEEFNQGVYIYNIHFDDRRQSGKLIKR
jgi:hypothetical protein